MLVNLIVTNRITKRAKREKEPSRVPVKIFMKKPEAQSICQITFFNNIDHRSNALLTDSYASS